MNLKQTALRYFEAGVTVFPATNHKKNPALASWKEYETKKPTKAEIEQWFSHSDVTGILALCGEQSNITVIDDDDYKTNNPLELESLLEAQTASGGRHIYFRYSPEVENANIRTDEHEFEIQNNGKLVMMPPSKAKNKQGEIGQYTWLKKHNNLKTLPILTSDFTAKFEVAIKQNYEMSSLLDVDLGQQHNSLRTMTNKLLFQTPICDWDGKVYPVIKAAAQNYNPTHPPQRVEKLWQDCKSWVKSKKLQKLQPKKLSQIIQEREVEKKLEEKAPLTGYDRLDKLIKGFIPGHLYVVTGNTNVGKTAVAANFAYNLGSKDKKVLYLALEPDNTIIDYLSTVAFDCEFNGFGSYYQSDNIDIYTKDQVKDIDHMMQLIKSLPRYDLIIIDHIGYFEVTSGRMNKTDKQSQIMKQLAVFAKKQKTAVMIIAHVRKDTGEQPSIDDISGSAAFKQDATDVLALFREVEDNEIGKVYLDTGYLAVLKTKSGPNGFFKILFKPRSAKIYDYDETQNKVDEIYKILK